MSHPICQVCKTNIAAFCDVRKSQIATHCFVCKNDLDHTHTQTYRTLESFIKTYGLVHIQLDSYNYFVTHEIQKMLSDIPTIIIKRTDLSTNKTGRYEYTFGKVFIDTPHLINEDRSVRKVYPREARERDINYSSPVFVDIITKVYDDDTLREVKCKNRVNLCYIPTMVGSVICNLYDKNEQERIKLGECYMDHGGYFILGGVERVLIPQMHLKYNYIQVIQQSDTASEKYKYICEIRTNSETGYSVLIRGLFPKEGRSIYFSLPNIDIINAGVVFKALGFVKDEEIINLINVDYPSAQIYIKQLLHDCANIKSKDDAITYISGRLRFPIQKEKQFAYAKQVVEIELLPHLGIHSTTHEKAIFLGYMINKLINTIIGIREGDDRDSMINKRIESSGMMIGDVFKKLLMNNIKKIQILLQKNPDFVSHISKDSSKKTCVITKGIEWCFKTGNWGVKGTKHCFAGASQVLDRVSFPSTLSHLRRLIFSTGKDSKNEKIRQIHTSQFGAICPSETPEGQQCGIVMNFSLLVRITRTIPTIIVKDLILSCKNFYPISSESFTDKTATIIFLNGGLIGRSTEPQLFEEEVKELRNCKRIDKTVSIVYDVLDNEINIYCDAGRFIRPLYVVENNKIYSGTNYDWDTLVDENHIRYVDFNEIENSVIAMNISDLDTDVHYDFCEIDPSFVILGVCASTIPFPDHSQSPRNCYQSSMTKQALGIPLTNINIRADTTLHIIDYPQRPLVNTNAGTLLGFNDMPSGQNPIVAILAAAWNQEDSNILNGSSIDRGLFHITTFFTIRGEETTRNEKTSYHIITHPNKELQQKKFNYTYLEPNGIIRKGVKVQKDDVIVGRIFTNTDNLDPKDTSIVIKPGEEGTIHNIIITTSSDGYKLVKVVIRLHRKPEVGDKFASREAQKGTCGMIMRQEDMPFTACGMTPDLIINPHCLADDHEILTENGFMNWKEVKDGYKNKNLKIAGYNSETKTLVYEYPTDFILNEAKEQTMIEFTCGEETDVSLLVTEDHDMYAKKGNCYVVDDNLVDYKKYKASELVGSKTFRFVKTISSGIGFMNDNPFKYLGLTSLEHTEAFCEVYGYWLYGYQNKLPIYVIENSKSISITYTREAEADWLIERFSILGLADRELVQSFVSDENNKRIYKFSIFNNEWKDMFFDTEMWKWMATWVWNLNSGLASRVLAGLQFADGCARKYENIIWTDSTQRRDEIVRLTLHAGFSSQFVSQQFNSRTVWKIIYTDLTHTKSNPVLYSENVKKVNYNGLTWCVSMPHGFIITRRSERAKNGDVIKASRPIITGQCIPSRMTINHLLETLLGKRCAVYGKYGNATPFTNSSVDITSKIGDELEKSGYERHGNEWLYDGATGKRLQAQIFIGPIFYQRLKHLVSDKMHARAFGHTTTLTRQPVEGRRQDGGLRHGEMERDCMLACGASRFLKERLFDMSDKYSVVVCKKCGMLCTSQSECKVCKETNVSKVVVPYVFKLLYQELMGMGLKLQLMPKC